MELSPQTLRLLCAAGDGDAALLYLWQNAEDKTLPCPLTVGRRQAAEAVLTRLGLTPKTEKPLPEQELKPSIYLQQNYSAVIVKK